MADPAARVRVIVCSVALAVVLGACGGTSPTAAPTTPVPSGVVAIDASEYKFAPATISVPAGAVTFSVTNAGTENHEFEVLQGEQTLGKIDAFTRETTWDLSLALEPGDYEFICRLNGHDILGMKGSLTVTGG